jgi:hypothetical protein
MTIKRLNMCASRLAQLYDYQFWAIGKQATAKIKTWEKPPDDASGTLDSKRTK